RCRAGGKSPGRQDTVRRAVRSRPIAFSNRNAALGFVSMGLSVLLKKIRPYVVMARVDHWIKNIFILPGFVCGYYFSPATRPEGLQAAGSLLLVLLASGLLSSANYVVNEYFDRDSDRRHPDKKNRVAPKNLVSAKFVFVEYALLLLAGLWAAASVGDA